MTITIGVEINDRADCHDELALGLVTSSVIFSHSRNRRHRRAGERGSKGPKILATATGEEQSIRGVVVAFVFDVY